MKRVFCGEVEEGGGPNSPPCRLKGLFCGDEEEAAPNSVWLPPGGRLEES